MGSTGSGSFGDYPGSRGSGAEGAGSDGRDGADAQPESDGQCQEPLVEVMLEDVGRCTYYRRAGDVPPAGTDVEVLNELVDRRVAVATASDHEVVGLLPTRFNYVLACVAQGFRYTGEVTAALSSPVPAVTVTLQSAV